MSDPQKYRVYEAEGLAFPEDGRGILHFRSLAQMQAFADKVIASDLWKSQTEVEEVKVFLGRKDSSKAKAYPRYTSWRGKVQHTPFVTMPPSWAATSHILIHELAHVATKGDGHGAKYAEFYLKLVKQFIGSLQAVKLRDAFDNQQVEYGEGPVRSTRQVEAASLRKDNRKSELEAAAEAFLAIGRMMKR